MSEAENLPEVAYFRYLGKSVDGEVQDEHGNVIPDIKTSIEAYGLTFHNKSYTEVPLDLISHWSQVPYSLYRKNFSRANPGQKPPVDPPHDGPGGLVDLPVYVVDKLRGNKEFQERENA